MVLGCKHYSDGADWTITGRLFQIRIVVSSLNYEQLTTYNGDSEIK